ncbi:CBS domain-containing protein [Labedaea rhizosphaerae]|uniref:CBS domain-containing protein n=1 Tax=Labedaea rhizosphaerae TaxID=598644 RepID=A0A4R6SFK7_LABRH|nr:CBS domain-containing protein [Labedaea rhizosphaerae]TDQ00364.1 CBS domain-containing protein [Labedaea rhizosphaerae]
MCDSTPPDLNGKTVGEVVVRLPKTLPADTTIDQARACFADEHVHMLLLTEFGRLVGTVVRGDLRDDLDGAEPVLTRSRVWGRTISAALPAEQARKLLLARGLRRLAVVDDDGTLLGLLCLKQRLTGFCSDAEVAARALARTCGPI